MLDVSGDQVPLRRPHFELRDGSLFFLRSARPFLALDAADAELWCLLDGARSVGALAQRVPSAEERLRALWASGVLELAPPCDGPPRRRALVLEPHMDDAALGLGGLMWARRRAWAFEVVTLAGRSNFTSYYHSDLDYFDPSTVSELRRAESALAMRLLGGRHRTLGLPEAPLRCHPGDWSRAWYRDHAKVVDAFVGHAAPEREVEEWSGAIARLLASSDAEQIWLPLGVGSHVDHELARDACLRALARCPEVVARASVHLYQDVPYAVDFPDHTARIVAGLVGGGAELDRHAEDISESLEHKQRLVSIYGSQFKASYVAPLVRDASRLASPSGTGHAELTFRMARPPGRLDASSLYSGAARVRRIAERMSAWYQRNRSGAHILLLSAVPMPRWHDDVDALLSCFPEASLEIHVRPDHLAEPVEIAPERVTLRPVLGARRAWVGRLARLALARPTPVLLVTGRGPERWLPLARAAFRPSDLFATVTMNDLVLALRALASRPSR